MKPRSPLDCYLRSGRRSAQMPQAIEVKFNPNHDERGRFTFAGQGVPSGGGDVMRAMGLPVDGGPKPQARPKAQPPKPHRTAQQQRSEPARKLRAIPGYSETGAAAWRSANDQVFIDAANKFNAERGFKAGDPEYVDPQLIKAWAMVESGGSKEAFLRDPLQVNNPGDWKYPKPQVIGLAKGLPMTPMSSTEAALKWLHFKGHRRDREHRPGPWIGFESALRRYNGRRDLHSDGVPHSVWYAREVMRLYKQIKKS